MEDSDSSELSISPIPENLVLEYLRNEENKQLLQEEGDFIIKRVQIRPNCWNTYYKKSKKPNLFLKSQTNMRELKIIMFSFMLFFFYRQICNFELQIR